ncbi:unnamed protein product [Ectocarpus sp. 12 AP-2014]
MLNKTRMPLHIPVAQTPPGNVVVPSCSKVQGPFTCLACSLNLVLKQGNKGVPLRAPPAFARVFRRRRIGPSHGGESCSLKSIVRA